MKKTFLAAIVTLLFCQISFSQDTTHEARMQWWRDARFGMFIHWGVYSVPAGTYKGQKASADVYIYSCEVVCENNEVLPFKGDITLLQ